MTDCSSIYHLTTSNVTDPTNEINFDFVQRLGRLDLSSENSSLRMWEVSLDLVHYRKYTFSRIRIKQQMNMVLQYLRIKNIIMIILLPFLQLHLEAICLSIPSFYISDKISHDIDNYTPDACLCYIVSMDLICPWINIQTIGRCWCYIYRSYSVNVSATYQNTFKHIFPSIGSDKGLSL